MVEGVRVDRSERSTRRSQTPFAPADRSRDDIEDLHDGRPQRSDGVRRSPCDVVRHSTSLAIGDVRQRDERSRVRDGVGLLDGIASIDLK